MRKAIFFQLLSDAKLPRVYSIFLVNIDIVILLVNFCKNNGIWNFQETIHKSPLGKIFLDMCWKMAGITFS
jgi:hypothetical protein